MSNSRLQRLRVKFRASNEGKNSMLGWFGVHKSKKSDFSVVLAEILVKRDVFWGNSENLRAPIWTVPSWSVQSAFTSEDDCNIDPKSTKLLIFFSSYYFKYIKYILLFYLSFFKDQKTYNHNNFSNLRNLGNL